jgi:hypothetical protein
MPSSAVATGAPLPAEDLGLRATPLVLRRSAGMIAIRGAAPKLSQAEILMINQ